MSELIIEKCMAEYKKIFKINKNYTFKIINKYANNKNISLEKASEELLAFAHKILNLYGSNVYKIINTVLIENKTIKYHMLYKVNDFNKLEDYFYIASDKIDIIRFKEEKIDPFQLYLRTYNIGKKI